MSALTLTTARAELAALLCADIDRAAPVDALAAIGFTAAYAYEPFTPAKPLSLTIWAAGIDSISFAFEVRVYRALDGDAASAQTDLELAVTAVDDLLASGGNWGPSAWTLGTTDERDALLAISRVQRIREDF